MRFMAYMVNRVYGVPSLLIKKETPGLTQGFNFSFSNFLPIVARQGVDGLTSNF